LIIDKDNPFFQNLNEEQINTTLANIYNKMTKMQYITAKFTIKTDKNIKIGDVINITIKDGTVHKAIVSAISISNIYSMSITSSGESQTRDYSSSNSSSSSGGSSDTGDKINFISDYNETEFKLVKDVVSIVNSASIYEAVKDNTTCSFSYNFNIDVNESNSGYIKINIYFLDAYTAIST
jgi:hypothetical protein